MLTLVNFDPNAVAAIRDFSAADPANPGSWTPAQAAAYSALSLRFGKADAATLNGGMAPYDLQAAQDFRVEAQGDRNVLTRFAALMARDPASGPFTRAEIAVCEHARTILTPYLDKNNVAPVPPDTRNVDFSHYDRVQLPAEDPVAYGETSLIAFVDDTKGYATLRDVPPSDHVYEQISDALGDRNAGRAEAPDADTSAGGNSESAGRPQR